MKFTKKDIEILKDIYNDSDNQLSQEMEILEKAADITQYTRYKSEKENLGGNYVSKTITRRQAVRLLGKRNWLTGIVRSAFHTTALREALDDKKISILFFISQMDNRI